MNTTENTPAHCHDCHKFDDCIQAPFMVEGTEPVDGWVYDGEVYCGNCNEDSCILYGGESDSPTHCAGCGVPIIHELTADGVDYVRENLGGCCRELWPTLYNIVAHIPIDSIEIPSKYVDLCQMWHNGQGCLLYAVSSTGGLTLGTLRPVGYTGEQWYLSIWRELASDISYAASQAGQAGEADEADLNEFEEWVDKQVIRLEESYGLADWDACDGYYT